VLLDDRFEVQYKYPLVPSNAFVVLQGKLLRKYVPGLRLPKSIGIS
jgi:hypothetical protein